MGLTDCFRKSMGESITTYVTPAVPPVQYVGLTCIQPTVDGPPLVPVRCYETRRLINAPAVTHTTPFQTEHA